MSGDDLASSFSSYLGLWHQAILREFGSPQNFRELIEESLKDPSDWFTDGERAELRSRYEHVMGLLMADGIPEDRARALFERSFLEALGGPQEGG